VTGGQTGRSMVGSVVLAGCLLLAVGCSSAIKQKVTEAAKGPACSAISGVQGKVSGASLENLSPSQLSAVQSASQQATSAVDALGSKLPSSLSTKLDDAQKQLTSAVQDTQGSAEERKAKLKSAGDGYAAQLDAVKAELGC